MYTLELTALLQSMQRLRKERGELDVPVRRKRRRPGSGAGGASASAREATQRVLKQRRVSKKINYAALDSLFGNSDDEDGGGGGGSGRPSAASRPGASSSAGGGSASGTRPRPAATRARSRGRAQGASRSQGGGAAASSSGAARASSGGGEEEVEEEEVAGDDDDYVGEDEDDGPQVRAVELLLLLLLLLRDVWCCAQLNSALSHIHTQHSLAVLYRCRSLRGNRWAMATERRKSRLTMSTVARKFTKSGACSTYIKLCFEPTPSAQCFA